MDVLDIIEQIRIQAHRDEKFRERLLESRNTNEPLARFCEVSREFGYEIYEMIMKELEDLSRKGWALS